MTHANPHYQRRWTILAILGIAQLMVVLDATIVNIALPSAQKALHFSNDNRQWIVSAYSLAFGSLLLLGGKISDLFGRKWTFIVGLSGFAIASAFGGAAQSFGMLTATEEPRFSRSCCRPRRCSACSCSSPITCSRPAATLR
jgi:MFS family permease